MNNTFLSIVAGVLTVLFLILNFTQDAGTIYLILAVVAAIATWYFATRSKKKA